MWFIFVHGPAAVVPTELHHDDDDVKYLKRPCSVMLRTWNVRQAEFEWIGTHTPIILMSIAAVLVPFEREWKAAAGQMRTTPIVVRKVSAVKSFTIFIIFMNLSNALWRCQER